MFSISDSSSNPKTNTMIRNTTTPGATGFKRKRPYRKSTKGCRTCKTRKTKCDERRPSCGGCLKYRKSKGPCIYDYEPTFVHRTSIESPNRIQLSRNNSATAIISSPKLSNIGSTSSMTLDPFMKYPTKNMPEVPMLVHHYLTSFVSRSFPFFAVGSCAKTLSEVWWPDICLDPLLFNIVLLASALDIENLKERKNSMRLASLNSECIYLLQKRINDPLQGISDRSINAVILLAVIERERGDLRAMTAHIRGLKIMIRLRGGLKAISFTTPVTACLVVWMSTLAMMPPLSCEDDDVLDEPTVSTASKTYFEDDNISDFVGQGIDEPLAQIFLEIRKKSKALGTQKDSSHFISLSVAKVYILLRLFKMRYSYCRELPLDWISECSRLGAILYILSSDRATYPDPTLLINAIVHKLRVALENMIYEETSTPLLLWILFVAGLSSQGAERKLFISHLGFVVEKMNLTSWHDIKLCIMGILWSDGLANSQGVGNWGKGVVALIDDIDVIPSIGSR